MKADNSMLIQETCYKIDNLLGLANRMQPFQSPAFNMKDNT